MTEEIEGYPIDEVERTIENWDDNQELPDKLIKAAIKFVLRDFDRGGDLHRFPYKLLLAALEHDMNNYGAALDELERGRITGKFPRDPLRPRGVADDF